MIHEKVFLVLGCILHAHSVLAIWSCSLDADCSSMAGSVCQAGVCRCPVGTQSVQGGTRCVSLAPYYTSQCIEDFQCSRLFTAFHCRRENSADEAGACFCSPNHHFFHGRCWPTLHLGDQCSRSEECRGAVNDPFAMACREGVCECAEDYYLRQRGECRRKGRAVGEGCVLDEDCQFEGGACNVATFLCIDSNAAAPAAPASRTAPQANQTAPRALRAAHGAACTTADDCPSGLECSTYGVCLCPLGYYPNADGSICLAELGSPVQNSFQCTGVFTEVHDGVCSCQANFFFSEDLRSCVKASRFITDSCQEDANCHTFGAHAHCGAPQQWGLRSCECDLNMTVWDASRSMCRLFAGVGEVCEVDSDCLAGELEIQCIKDEGGQGRCTCPEGYVEVDGLCLILGLKLGDACQVSLECTGTPNTVCADGYCACDSGYQPLGDICAPTLGGTCEADTDCVINNTVCANATSTCQCDAGFVEYQDLCWHAVPGFGSWCNVTAQCSAAIAGASACADGTCVCAVGHHYRDGGCWQQTGLFEACSRSSECYLAGLTERVHCRNSLCQCQFQYPFSEEERTCRSSAATVFGQSMIIIASLFLLFSR